MTMAGWLGRVQAGQGLTPPCLSFPITVTAQNYPAVTPGLEGDSCSLQKKSRNPGVLRSAVKPHIPVVMPVCPLACRGHVVVPAVLAGTGCTGRAAPRPRSARHFCPFWSTEQEPKHAARDPQPSPESKMSGQGSR